MLLMQICGSTDLDLTLSISTETDIYKLYILLQGIIYYNLHVECFGMGCH